MSMKLIQYFYEGSMFYMVTITVFGLAMIGISILKIWKVVWLKQKNPSLLSLILLFGSLSFITGIIAQAHGLSQALGVIAKVKDISVSLMAAGFKLSFIAPIYGLMLFMLSLIFWALLKELSFHKK